MGQQSLTIPNRLSIVKNSNSKLLKYAQDGYINEHYKVGCEANKDKVRHHQLLAEILCTDNCELIDWIFKKINGALTDKDKAIGEVQLSNLKLDFNIFNINNNIIEQLNWDKVEW